MNANKRVDTAIPNFLRKLQDGRNKGIEIVVGPFISDGAGSLLEAMASAFGIPSTATPLNLIKPIDDLRRLHVLASTTIDRLLFAHGQGKQMLVKILTEEKHRIAAEQTDESLDLCPDAIASYLADFTKRCEFPYEALPTIPVN